MSSSFFRASKHKCCKPDNPSPKSPYIYIWDTISCSQMVGLYRFMALAFPHSLAMFCLDTAQDAQRRDGEVLRLGWLD